MATEESDFDIEDELGDEDQPVPLRYSITSYGADYPVDSLVKRMENKAIFVPPFQRRYVWNMRQASRFIESLLLGLPVPGIFLSKEQKTGKLLVIDGQQRLLTLQYYYGGIFADSQREFVLRGVQEQFKGLGYKSLPTEDQRRLDDAILHATIVQQEEPSEDQSSIYHIFERLNTGGTQLVPQEIRACIFHGEFNDLLKELNKSVPWRALFGVENKRMRDRELILRFFAMYFNGDQYAAPMTEFLNVYMGQNCELQKQSKDELTVLFSETVSIIHKSIEQRAFRRKKAFNAAVYDSVMVGVARRLSRGSVSKLPDLAAAYDKLLADNEFVVATEKATAREDNVQKRLAAASLAFSQLQ